jgi:predicted transcriptional regulator
LDIVGTSSWSIRMSVAAELAYYDTHEAEWQQHTGEHVVIKDCRVVGFYRTEGEALVAGASAYGATPFLVLKIGEAPLRLNGSMVPSGGLSPNVETAIVGEIVDTRSVRGANLEGNGAVADRYNSGYTRWVKTAISLPDELFDAAEALAERLGMSRSQLYAAALAAFVEQHDAAAITERLNAAYADEADDGPDRWLAAIQARSVQYDAW